MTKEEIRANLSLIWENENTFEKIQNYTDSEILYLSVKGFNISAYVSHELNYNKINGEYCVCGYIEEMTINYHYSEDHGDFDNWYTIPIKQVSEFTNSKDYEDYLINRFVRLVTSKKFKFDMEGMESYNAN